MEIKIIFLLALAVCFHHTLTLKSCCKSNLVVIHWDLSIFPAKLAFPPLCYRLLIVQSPQRFCFSLQALLQVTQDPKCPRSSGRSASDCNQKNKPWISSASCRQNGLWAGGGVGQVGVVSFTFASPVFKFSLQTSMWPHWAATSINGVKPRSPASCLAPCSITTIIMSSAAAYTIFFCPFCFFDNFMGCSSNYSCWKLQ